MGVGTLQNAYDNMKKSRRDAEHPVLIYTMFVVKAALDLKEKADKGERPDDQTLSRLQLEIKSLVDSAEEIQTASLAVDLAVPHGVAELFAYRLSKAAGVLVPEVRLETEYRGQEKDWLVKPVMGCFVSSRLVPDALPIYFLKDKDKTVHPAIAGLGAESRIWEYELYLLSKAQGQFKERYDKRCPLNRKFYKGFSTEDETRPEVLSAARWDSPARLLIHAWRAFLHATYPHNSNVLVDTRGNLHVIDHERMVYSPDEADIHKLAVFVKHSPVLFDVCRQISKITEGDISEALEDIPDRFWKVELPKGFSPIKCLARDPKTAKDYFTARLRTWRLYFS